ncbi:hypothetical protein HMI56_000376, partial [Coelomomyces lativittatus]
MPSLQPLESRFGSLFKSGPKKEDTTHSLSSPSLELKKHSDPNLNQINVTTTTTSTTSLNSRQAVVSLIHMATSHQEKQHSSSSTTDPAEK